MLAGLVAIALMAALLSAEDAVLQLRAKVVPAATGGALTITVFRWSTDAERAPLLTALSAPPPAPAAGRAGAAPAGRGGRGGGRGAPPPTPLERLATAVKAAPTLGYIWGDGVTGYSIKYAWHSPAAPAGRDVGRGFSPADGFDRIVLVTDRRLGVHAPDWALPATPGPHPDFTVIEMRLDAAGAGEGKLSLSSGAVVDSTASTLAVDRYAAAPTLLKVSR